ncbi:MAG: hypothetical protein P8Z33_13305 [Gammaproteobacteria bacterium]|jgi:hypothetical protein
MDNQQGLIAASGMDTLPIPAIAGSAEEHSLTGHLALIPPRLSSGAAHFP